MPEPVLIGGWKAIRGSMRNYVIAEQWLGTYRVTHNPRHLDTALTCRTIADELYSQSTDQYLGRDEAVVRQICSESRKRVSEAFAALGYAPYVAAPVKESPDPSR